jgi:hypothetical protein
MFFGIPIDETAWRLLGAVGILFLGFIIARVGSRLISRTHKRRFKSSIKKSPVAKLFRNIVTTISIVITLFFLRVGVTEDFFLYAYQLIPDILSFVLLISLVVIIVNSVMTIIEKIIDKSGVANLIKEYDHGFILNMMLAILRILLYLILGVLALNSIGIASTFSRTLSYVIYPIFIFFLVLLAFGLKDFISNFFSGMYIKSSPHFQMGQKIRYRNLTGTIEEINNTSVLMTGEGGYSLHVPNSEFMKREIGFKEVKTDLPTLETIKNQYVAQTPSNCGPASASMILDIFGYHYTQEKIAETAGTAVGKGTHPVKLIESVAELTDDKVNGVWIDIDKINDLRDEVVSWLNDGALVVVDYKKSFLFPDAKKAHYSIVLAVEGDEFVVLDPSSIKGGVYLADYKNIEKGMDTFSDLIKGKRGYIVFAPKDSRAYNRLKQGLIYSDVSLYTRLSRKLQREFKRVVEKTEFVEDMLPKRVRDFVDGYKNKEKISRVWRPEPRTVIENQKE